MGNIFAAMKVLFGKTEHRILMLGLDAAGKTTVLYRLKLGQAVTTIPTIGFNVETVTYKNISFTMWDVGGRDKTRALWRHYVDGTSAVIFIVDSNDRDRIDQAAESLNVLLGQEALQDAPVLVLANKQDLSKAMSMGELAEGLDVAGHGKRPIKIQPTVATEGTGLFEGLEWLSLQLAKKRI